MEALSNNSEGLHLVEHYSSRDASSFLSFTSSNIVTSVVTLGVAFLTLVYWRALPKPIPGIPYTKKSRWHPFGDAFDFVNYSKDTGEGFRWFATKAAELKSPIFQVFLGPFTNPIVVVADIQEIIDISTRRTREFDRGGFLTDWVGILFPQGTISMASHDKFKDQRSTWSATMTTQFLNTASARTIHGHTSSLINLWTAKVQLAGGRPFEVSDDLKQVTFDMVCTRIWTAATGDDLGLITRRIKAATSIIDADVKVNKDEAVTFPGPDDLPEIVHACEVLVEHLKNMRGSVWLRATKMWLSMTSSWTRAWDVKEVVMTQLIESSREKFATAGGGNREVTCAMDEIFKRDAKAEVKGKQASYREMIDETFSYIVGGHETTQDTTKWSLKYLTANQEKQAKLREALLSLWPNATAHNLPSFQEIIAAEHPYVEASVQELIRIALTAPSWTRRSTKEVVVLGHRIPPGIDLFGAPSVQSIDDMDDFDIDPDLRSPTSRPRTVGRWDKPTKGLYQPERWIDKNGNYDPYAGPMLPFGAGPRGCFGQRLARIELRMMIIMLVLSFEFQPIPETYASFRADEVINRGPHITYIRPVLRA